MAEWIEFSQYEGFAILDDATKIRTPEGEQDLRPGKLFYFINPNTGVKNFAKPDVLLARAKGKRSAKTKEPREPKAAKEPKPKKEYVPKGSLKVTIKTIGRDAVVRALETKCTLYYKTDKWGWQQNNWDPAEILNTLDHPVESDAPPLWYAHRFGVE